MFENRFVAGIVAGIPISLVCLGYVAVRRDEVVRLFSEGGSDAMTPGAMSPGAATALAVVAAVAVGPGLGLLAALVRGWIPSQPAFLGLAVVLATLLSGAAIAARTPMIIEKVVLNYVVAIMFGFVAPRLVAGLG